MNERTLDFCRIYSKTCINKQNISCKKYVKEKKIKPNINNKKKINRTCSFVKEKKRLD